MTSTPTEPDQVDEPELPLLSAPSGGLPPVVTDEAALAQVVAAFAAGSGPVAVDAERASGYRYGQRAFLVQLRREGAGTALIDPAALPDLSALGAALEGVEWVLHAANQDLPCLAELGMRPTSLFDTELGSRIAGLPRVGLGAVVEELLGLRLAKEHSAVDWSTRPLPEPWLTYAALDVEVLVRLRDVLAERLAAQGKLQWALEEFAAVAAAPPPTPPAEPWRRVSGLHAVRSRRQLAVVRELWSARDAEARQKDTSPGRLLPDSAIVAAARAVPRTPQALAATPGFTGRASRSRLDVWFEAVARGAALPEADLPAHTPRSDGPPPPRAWAAKDPLAAARLSAARAVVTDLAAGHGLPVENLLQPDALRRVVWAPPSPLDADGVRAALAARGARAWQLDLVSAPVARAMAEATVETPVEAGTDPQVAQEF
ncbi:HRDC domain-containing protein [Kineococcus rhizosphaerae]|uniref:Ribonuclease D n=1 Tax=Kineococcus rhizosphaerae TaxID=559628 RepID=A0A2T0RAZ7_9ACTN|nr:ribonuclease D [Kineococcus rhizosphaerae]PRY18335.1 ribonuclease D [Kineococcus rhizosphaerae]